MKSISETQYQRLLGLGLLKERALRDLQQIHKASCEVLGKNAREEFRDGGHTSDWCWTEYYSIDDMLENLGIQRKKREDSK